MSFFGFDSALPRDRAQAGSGRGFFEARADPFAAPEASQDNGAILNFDDTYDGLGDDLVETGDTFNDDTFGGGTAVGRDFDFSGQGASVQPSKQPVQPPQYARQPSYQSSSMYAQQPNVSGKSGYESYKQPDYIPQLEASASIWGLPAKKPTPVQAPEATQTVVGRKMMSLEEVEASMRNPTVQAPPPQPTQPSYQQPQEPAPQYEQFQQTQAQQPQQPQQYQEREQPNMRQDPSAQVMPQPMQILQRHPDRPQPQQSQMPPGPLGPPGHMRGASINGRQITDPQQMANLPPQDRQKFLEDETKRAKRHHKMFMLSRGNGLMTPQDKNFITRIQLQQLVTASGNLEGKGTEGALVEDFYYQVHFQIRGAQRQPSGQFAQTYLLQTGGRSGHHRRGQRNGGDNHATRMEQQVKRAVEAAKARPKNKQLTVTGSLGKIAFSNSKTPRPLLNVSRLEHEARINQAARGKTSVADRRATLENIEKSYATLMQLEDHERRLPRPPTEESNPGAIQQHIEWRQRAQELNVVMWSDLKVMAPVQADSPTLNPFIDMLTHDKGKKLIPRVFRHIDDQQRITALTLIVIHLDKLDVVRLAYPQPNSSQLPRAVVEAVETFSQAVMPALFAIVNDAPLSIVSGMLGLILDRVNVQIIARTKIGVSMLTMLISRAELIKQANTVSEEEWAQWMQLYSSLFDVLEPVLPHLFSSDSVAASNDVDIWQFLAAMGVGASPEQQQRLVVGVKDRVMETVGVAKTLTPDVAASKLAEVNLFMRAIGLDVDLLG